MEYLVDKFITRIIRNTASMTFLIYPQSQFPKLPAKSDSILSLKDLQWKLHFAFFVVSASFRNFLDQSRT